MLNRLPESTSGDFIMCARRRTQTQTTERSNLLFPVLCGTISLLMILFVIGSVGHGKAKGSKNKRNENPGIYEDSFYPLCL